MKTERSNFYTLQQTGPFATPENLNLGSLASPVTKNFASSLSHQERTEYRSMRGEVFSLLGVNSYKEIDALQKNPEKIQEVSDRAYMMIGKMYGIEGSLKEIKSEVESYAKTADNVIDDLRKDTLDGLAMSLEMVNEIQAINNPVELLLIAHNNRFSPRPRLEAVRKLELMKLAASIHQRERESDISNKFARFIGYMNKNVWSQDYRTGDSEDITLISTHDPDTYGATQIEILSNKDAIPTPLPYQKPTPLSRRRFYPNGHEVSAYVTIRQKPDVAKVLKLLRKNDQNPATAVDDELGVMVVLNSYRDVQLFMKHLSQSAGNAGSQMTIEDISDTLDGSSYNNKNAGSSNGVRMLKFFAKMEGMRVEFVVHTNETYIDQLYKRGVSHAEYEVNRVFNSGVVDILFPERFYKIDREKAHQQAIKKRRANIENQEL